jgi:Holliday junction DNA helicase RuvA
MIGSLRGRIAAKAPPQLMIDVGGVGYELEAPMSTFFHLPAIGQEVSLLTHLVVREDAQMLYGFATADERRLFRNLLKVSGIGPKIALALLSGISVEAFAQCIVNEDIASLIRVPGIGRKTAERLLVEMRDRVANLEGVDGMARIDGASASPQAEALGALMGLGYKPAEAARLLKAVEPGTHTTEELIRRALQGAARD